MLLRNLAKRLTEKQKEEIKKSFLDGKTIEILSQNYDCTKVTIIRNLKSNLGLEKFKEFMDKKKLSKDQSTTIENEKIDISNIYLNKKDLRNTHSEILNSNLNSSDIDYSPDSSFMEIIPLDYEIDNIPRKEISSVPLSDIELPPIVYMVVDRKIELEIKLLKDYPEWGFLPVDDLNRKTIEIYFESKIAKRVCNKDQKVIKIPNTDVFRIASPQLISRGISRIISSDKLISL